MCVYGRPDLLRLCLNNGYFIVLIQHIVYIIFMHLFISLIGVFCLTQEYFLCTTATSLNGPTLIGTLLPDLPSLSHTGIQHEPHFSRVYPVYMQACIIAQKLRYIYKQI